MDARVSEAMATEACGAVNGDIEAWGTGGAFDQDVGEVGAA